MNETSVDLNENHGFGPIPQKRQKRAAFVSTSLSLVIVLVMLGAFTQPKMEYKPVWSNRSHDSESGIVSCAEKPKYYHVGIFIWALNVVGVILGEFVNRFCLMFEEYFHLYTRYNGSKMKMIIACFSDISFKAVLFATLVAFIIIVTTLLSQGSGYFKLEYIEIILSGLGSGSLILYLLSLDTLSRVQISELMENNNRLVANGLAWSFYFGYLKIILPGMHERIPETPWAYKLSSNKLFILMPRNCFAFGKINEEDCNIEVQENPVEYKRQRAGVYRSYRNFVYQVNAADETFYVLAEYATPLCSLYDMSHDAEAKLSPEDRDEQAKLFLRTLETILENPSEPAVRGKCKLVPYGRTKDTRLCEVLAAAIREERGEENSQRPTCAAETRDNVPLVVDE